MSLGGYEYEAREEKKSKNNFFNKLGNYRRNSSNQDRFQGSFLDDADDAQTYAPQRNGKRSSFQNSFFQGRNKEISTTPQKVYYQAPLNQYPQVAFATAPRSVTFVQQPANLSPSSRAIAHTPPLPTQALQLTPRRVQANSFVTPPPKISTLTQGAWRLQTPQTVALQGNTISRQNYINHQQHLHGEASTTQGKLQQGNNKSPHHCALCQKIQLEEEEKQLRQSQADSEQRLEELERDIAQRQKMYLRDQDGGLDDALLTRSPYEHEQNIGNINIENQQHQDRQLDDFSPHEELEQQGGTFRPPYERRPTFDAQNPSQDDVQPSSNTYQTDQDLLSPLSTGNFTANQSNSFPQQYPPPQIMRQYIQPLPPYAFRQPYVPPLHQILPVYATQQQQQQQQQPLVYRQQQVQPQTILKQSKGNSLQNSITEQEIQQPIQQSQQIPLKMSYAPEASRYLTPSQAFHSIARSQVPVQAQPLPVSIQPISNSEFYRQYLDKRSEQVRQVQQRINEKLDRFGQNVTEPAPNPFKAVSNIVDQLLDSDTDTVQQKVPNLNITPIYSRSGGPSSFSRIN